MKLKNILYGIFGLAFLFAGIALYLFFFSRDSDESNSAIPVMAEFSDRGKTSSGKAGKLGIAYAGDLIGSLTPCNCTDPASGGVARRATAISDFKRDRKNVPILVADTGNAMKQTDNLEDPSNRWVVEALEALSNDVINTNLGDLRRLERLAKSGRIRKDLRNNYIAAMLESSASRPFPTMPFWVKNLRSESGSEEARVGVLAISPIPSGALPTANPIGVDTALKRYLSEVDAKSDIVILLTRMQDEELKRIARAYPGIDVIINGNSTGEGRELPKMGNTVIVESARQGIALGTLDLEWDSGGHITKYKNQMIPLIPAISDSPQLASIIIKSKQEAVVFAEMEARNSPPLVTKSVFAGSKSCKTCHEKAYNVWAKSKHAQSLASLKKESNQFKEECLGCHVTGINMNGGFTNIIQTPELAAVNCEACHGTSLKHVAAPKEEKPGLGNKITEKSCQRCHDQVYSPGFQYKDYWSKIAH
jgi:cytochrome c5